MKASRICHATALQLNVNERQTVDQNRHVVTVRVRPLNLVLVDDLQPVVMDVALIDQTDVLERAVIALRTWISSSWIRAVFSTIPSLDRRPAR